MPSKTTRVIVLLTALAVVALWGWGRSRTRAMRVSWRQPVVVAVFFSGDVDAAGAATLSATLDAIGARIEQDRRRLASDAGGGEPLFTFELVGPLQPARLPPAEPPADGWVDRALHAASLWRAERAAFAAAPGFDPGLADVRIHLLASKPVGGVRSAEGIGAAGGDVGVVAAALDGGDALLAATAVVHEVLHCLGATDKYDDAGHAVPPDGLAEPERAPPYPQRFAEIMVGEVPLGPGAGRLPAGPHELAIGPATAAEIGWSSR